MVFNELERHVQALGFTTSRILANNQSYLLIQGVPISAGSHAGQHCDVAVRDTGGNPWLPEAAVHVRPHLARMGERASKASPLGGDWQYLSRRFNRPPTPQTFYAHILTVLEEL
jgi:hypothetical protein